MDNLTLKMTTCKWLIIMRLDCIDPMQIILLLSYGEALLTQFKMKTRWKAPQLNFNNQHYDLIVKKSFHKRPEA